jgi:predicted DNA-binding transcriptional regulator YafY
MASSFPAIRTVPVLDNEQDQVVTETAGRLLQLLALLQRRPTWTGRELAERLGVDARTVRRDIGRIRDLGYPVESVPGGAGGYRLGVGADLPPLLLDEDEAMAVAVLLGIAAGVAVPGIERAALATLARIDRLLPPGASNPTVSSLPTAAGTCLRTTWTEGTGGRSGWTGRARSAVPGIPSCQESYPDPARVVAEAISVTGYHFRAIVKFGASAEQVAKLVPPNAGPVEESDGAARLTIGVDDAEWLTGYLLRLGLPFEVVSLPELRDAVVALCERVAAAHRGGP